MGYMAFIPETHGELPILTAMPTSLSPPSRHQLAPISLGQSNTPLGQKFKPVFHQKGWQYYLLFAFYDNKSCLRQLMNLM